MFNNKQKVGIGDPELGPPLLAFCGRIALHRGNVDLPKKFTKNS